MIAKTPALWGALLLALVGHTSCKSSAFQGNGNRQGMEVVNGNIVQTFDITKSSRKVDLVWVIDNSASMNNEAASVRSNFTSFISTLGNSTDLKLALISAPSLVGSGAGTGVMLPVSGPNYLQVARTVGSNDPLQVAAQASCPANTFIAASKTICNKSIPTLTNFDMTSFQNATTNGALTSFLRPDANRIYVIVTDDDARKVDSSNFLSMIAPYNQNRNPIVFAFMGFQSVGGCQISRRGASYEALAAATGGKTFDICQADWRAHFTNLQQSVQTIANASYNLNFPATQVVSVKVDGVVVPAGQYTLNGSTLTISPTYLTASSQKVVIEYKK